MLKLLPALALLLVTSVATAAESWEAIVAKAKGQTVYWNAWAGDEKINAYIDWAGDQVLARYGVTVEHVKVTDTAEAVSRVVAEKAAGRNSGGSVDLIWINGENFAAMKREGLLFGPWVEQLPNFSLVDTIGKPTTLIDFTVPVEGLEAPWGMAQIVFMYDSAQVPEPPLSIGALASWAKANPGRFTYPQPPNFLGSTFLKQALIELTDDPKKLQKPVANDAEFTAVTAPLWPYLDELNPVLWRSGKVFPQNGPAQRRLLGDGEIDIAISFSPPEASSAIANNELPDTVRTFVLEGGTIGNTNFVAIPYNANAKEGAMVLANFLLSPTAQVRKQDPTYWGGLTVLDLSKLSVEDLARFEALDLGIATLSPSELGKTLLEPHPSWMERIEAEWQRRYATGS
ncbi:MAG: ABC transporter substrate-binding protein [Candidatus Competibacteraceae bacterium]|jgi:putative thiamine transport system substrate-binding protein|nr:ABC transporter substrate-binding protein [Candidatus Competibacteraceae bacterium]